MWVICGLAESVCCVSGSAWREGGGLRGFEHVQPDSESNPVAAVSEAAPEPPPETVEGVPDAPAATATGGGPSPTAAPRAEDPVKMAAEPAAEDPATAGSSQVA